MDRDRNAVKAAEAPEGAVSETPFWRRDDHDQVEHNMTNHAPLHPGVVELYDSLRRAAKLFAHTVVDVCPAGRERSLALTNAEQALMWAVASIARDQS